MTDISGEIEYSCVACKAQVAEDSVFCHKCGAKFNGVNATTNTSAVCEDTSVRPASEGNDTGQTQKTAQKPVVPTADVKMTATKRAQPHVNWRPTLILLGMSVVWILVWGLIIRPLYFSDRLATEIAYLFILAGDLLVIAFLICLVVAIYKFMSGLYRARKRVFVISLAVIGILAVAVGAWSYGNHATGKTGVVTSVTFYPTVDIRDASTGEEISADVPEDINVEYGDEVEYERGSSAEENNVTRIIKVAAPR